MSSERGSAPRTLLAPYSVKSMALVETLMLGLRCELWNVQPRCPLLDAPQLRCSGSQACWFGEQQYDEVTAETSESISVIAAVSVVCKTKELLGAKIKS